MKRNCKVIFLRISMRPRWFLFIWVDSEMLEEVFYIFRVLLLIRCWSFFASMIFSPCLFSAKNFSPFEKKKKKLFPVVAKNLLLQKFPPLGKTSTSSFPTREFFDGFPRFQVSLLLMSDAIALTLIAICKCYNTFLRLRNSSFNLDD